MHKDWQKMAGELSKAIGHMREEIPDTMGAFSNLAQVATSPGVLDTKTKELIATAISVAVRCDGCLAFHIKAAVKNGATKEEIVETTAMGIYMGGGPSMVYGAQALEAFEQFSGEATD